MYKVRSMASTTATDSRIGQPWTADEDKQLLEEIGSKMDLTAIADIHKRTPKGIKLRLVHHAIQLIDKKVFSIETAADHFGISRLDIEDQKAKKVKETKIATFKEKQPEYHEKYLEILSDIRDTLKVLCEHITKPAQQPTSVVSVSDSFTVPSLSPYINSPKTVKIIRKPSLPAIQQPQPQQQPQQQQQPQPQQPQHNETNDITLNVGLPKLKIDIHNP
jgi:hypothetical protein